MSHCRWSVSLVPICKKSLFSSKVFAHLDIRYYMTFNLLISWRQLWYVFIPNLKIKPDVLHLFTFGAPPKGISSPLIKWIWLLYWLRDLDAKLFRSNPIIWLQLSNDAVALCQHMPDPPCKLWVAYNMALYRIFVHVHRVWVIHILEGHSQVVLPYFHCTRTSTPFVVSLRRFVPVHIVMNASWFFTSVPSYLWLKIT